MLDPADLPDVDPHEILSNWEILPMYFCPKCGVNARVSPGKGPKQKWACHVCLNVTTDLMQFERIGQKDKAVVFRVRLFTNVSLKNEELCICKDVEIPVQPVIGMGLMLEHPIGLIYRVEAISWNEPAGIAEVTFEDVDFSGTEFQRSDILVNGWFLDEFTHGSPDSSNTVDIAAAIAKLEEIVCTEGCDAGVVLLSEEGPTHQEVWDGKPVRVYDHEYFSPLGDALIALYKILKGESDAARKDG